MDRLYPHKHSVMKVSFCKLFKSIKEDVSSHDFRHTKLTDLGKFLRPHEIRDYAGHSSIRVTDRYLHSNQEGVLRKVEEEYFSEQKREQGQLSNKRLAKATEKNFENMKTKLRREKSFSPFPTSKNESQVSVHSINLPR